MLKKILYILLCISIIFYLFIISFKLEKLSIQLQEIGTTIQNMNQKSKNSPKRFQYSSPNEQLYVKIRLKITAYSSEISQTDSEPYIGAWANKVRKGMIAVSRDLEKIGITNGTPIVIKYKKGDIHGIILDKMGEYKTTKKRKIKIINTLDIWMETREEALKWGVKYLPVEVPLNCINFDELIKLDNNYD
ncbi:MAG: hypothetical protein ACFFDY_00600 [Candidatus Thorarchaeota archaeon]